MIFEDIFQKKAEKRKQKKPIKIIADHREKNSLVISELHSLGIEVEIKHLNVGDFIIGKTAIERKTVSDFLSSMINKRLTRQLQEIKQYPSYLLLIEGTDHQELYNDDPEGIHGNAIRGFLLDILLKYKVPIILTKDYEDTANFLTILAKKQKKEIPLRERKKTRDKKESLQYIMEGFPGIGPKTAKKLLKKYKTIKNIINLTPEQLHEEIGKKSESFFKLIKENY